MTNLISSLAQEIQNAETLEEYRKIVSKYGKMLSDQGQGEIGSHIKELADIKENKFSKRSARESLEHSKNKVLDFLAELSYTDVGIQEEQAVRIIKEILGNFPVYCRNLYQEPVHGRCSNCLKEHLPQIKIENEYDLQRLLYPVICAIFKEARVEECEDSGHHTVRKDIVLDAQDIVIELKCSSRSSITERQLGEEIASDMIHYGNKHIFFYIYDQNRVIKNVENFKRVYEEKKVGHKMIYMFVLQPNGI